MKQFNFGRNVQLSPRQFDAPESEQEVLGILNQAGGKSVRCVGRLHSWSPILDGPDVLLSLEQLDAVRPFELGGDRFVEVGAGCQIKRLLDVLDRERGWTLPSVGFITEQTVAGAISTGTHGSGRHSLSHYVVAIRIARYDPETGKAIITEITQGDELRAARCSLGCLGVILSVTMQCREAYSVEEHFCEYPELDAVMQAEERFPLQQFFFVPWRWTFYGQHRRETDCVNSRLLFVFRWYRFLVFDVAMHWLVTIFARWLRSPTAVRALFRWAIPAFVIQNWRVVGPSHSQLVMEHELFRHIEIELFVQRHRLDTALCFLKSSLRCAGDAETDAEETFLDQVVKAALVSEFQGIRGSYVHHYPICVRRIFPDDTLVSMASRSGESPMSDSELRDEAWYSITLTNYHRGSDCGPFMDVSQFLAVAMMRLFDARVHWGKLFPCEAGEVVGHYPKFERFQKVCAAMDPAQVFCNAWTKQLLQAAESSSVVHEESPHESPH